jgi:hypothetical protein
VVIALSPTYTISVGDIETVAIDYTDHLDGSEALTGTPSADVSTIVGTGALTVTNVALNSVAKAVLGRDVAINYAVQFAISGQRAGETYRVRVTAATNGTPSRTIVRDVYIIGA